MRGLTPEEEIRATWAAIVELANGTAGQGVATVRALHSAAVSGLRGRELEERLAENSLDEMHRPDPSLPPTERRLPAYDGPLKPGPGDLSAEALDRLIGSGGGRR